MFFCNAIMHALKAQTIKLIAFLGLLSGSAHFHFDASFRSCPKGLKHVAIAMILDEQSEKRAPKMRILMTGKFSVKHKTSN